MLCNIEPNQETITVTEYRTEKITYLYFFGADILTITSISTSLDHYSKNDCSANTKTTGNHLS